LIPAIGDKEVKSEEARARRIEEAIRRKTETVGGALSACCVQIKGYILWEGQNMIAVIGRLTRPGF
jgi:hypothetical protein